MGFWTPRKRCAATVTCCFYVQRFGKRGAFGSLEALFSSLLTPYLRAGESAGGSALAVVPNWDPSPPARFATPFPRWGWMVGLPGSNMSEKSPTRRDGCRPSLARAAAAPRGALRRNIGIVPRAQGDSRGSGLLKRSAEAG